MDPWLLQCSILVIDSACHVMGNGRTQTSVHSNCVHRTTKVSAVLLCNFSNSPKSFKSNNTVTEAECRCLFCTYLYRSRDTQNLISDGWCLQDSCKGISRWHSNGQQLLWPQTRARWRGQRGSLHHSWRTPHPDSRWDLPRPPPAVPRCCSATEQGAGCQRGQSVFMDNTQSAFRPQAKPVRAQKMLGGTDGQVRNAVYLYYSLWHAQ